MACIREAKSKFFNVLSFVNVEGSSIDRDSDGVIYTKSGPEIGVASTKNYSAQLLTIYLFSLYMGRLKGILTESDYLEHLDQIKKLPVLIEQALNQESAIQSIVDRYFESKVLFLLEEG